jgi:hypothetical protein
MTARVHREFLRGGESSSRSSTKSGAGDAAGATASARQELFHETTPATSVDNG